MPLFTGNQGNFIPSALAVLLLAYHTFVSFRSMRGLPFGYTIIEWHEKRLMNDPLWVTSPYSRGTILANLMAVLGGNPFLLLLPLGPASAEDPLAPVPSREGALALRAAYPGAPDENQTKDDKEKKED